LPYVTYESSDRIATIRLNRPERLNAFGRQLHRDLADAFATFAEDEAADVAVIAGAGSSICAGRDLKEEAAREREPTSLDGIPAGQLNRNHVRDTPKPLITAVHGFAIGAGFGLTLGGDYRIATRDAVFAYTEIETGIPGPWDLAIYQMIPWTIATEIALLGHRLSAQRLYEVGLLNEVVEPGQHEERARAVARDFLRLPQAQLRATKELMILGRPRPSEAAIARRKVLGEELRPHPARYEALERFGEHGAASAQG
jgi:enoyl-CoA hydratase/carnithine racemase